MKKISEKVLHKGRFLWLKESTYLNRDGLEIKWESIGRKTPTRVVVMMSKLVPSNKYVFIRQFRPAVDNFVLGLPAGIVSEDNVEAAALRELKEETGYVGRVVGTSPKFKMSPALLEDDAYIVTIEIDEALSENIKPKQELEADEQIEVILVGKNDIKELVESELKKGHFVASAIWYYLLGRDF